MATLDRGVLQVVPGLNLVTGATNISIADLFALVKQYDTNFSPKPVGPATINPDGMPKLVERGGVTGYINGGGQFKAADNLGSFNSSDPNIRHSRRSDTLLSEASSIYIRSAVPAAQSVLVKQLSDPNGWLAQAAAREVLHQAQLAQGAAAATVAVQFVGMPEPGMPTQDTGKSVLPILFVQDPGKAIVDTNHA